MKKSTRLWPKFQGKRVLLIPSGLLRGVSVSVPVALAVTLVPMSAGVAVAETPATSLVFMSPEEYHQLKLGRSAATAVLVSSVSQLKEPGSAVVPLRQPPPDDWSMIKWDESDLRGVSTPVRLGDTVLGFRKYSTKHNLESRVPIHAAFQTHKPDKEIGAHLEYIAYAVKPDDLEIVLTVRVVVQAAARTEDGVYLATDGKNIGVITAFCEDVPDNVCPSWVNDISGPVPR